MAKEKWRERLTMQTGMDRKNAEKNQCSGEGERSGHLPLLAANIGHGKSLSDIEKVNTLAYDREQLSHRTIGVFMNWDRNNRNVLGKAQEVNFGKRSRIPKEPLELLGDLYSERNSSGIGKPENFARVRIYRYDPSCPADTIVGWLFNVP